MKKERWQKDFPGLFFLDPEDLCSTRDYLAKTGLLEEGEAVLSVSRGGEGNMNCTVRATTDRHSLILKQSRPWVEKYPQFDAPVDRAIREMDFYETVQGHPVVSAGMPRILYSDSRTRLLILEDLGAGRDYTGVYRGDSFEADEIEGLASYLSALHNDFLDHPNPSALANREMRDLNAAHIFDIPLQANNGLHLDGIVPGLQSAAESLQQDAAYVQAVHALAHEYLSDGPSLVHGDFFPGSLLRTDQGLKIIDPEFCFFGRQEFDVGVFLAHLVLARQAPDLVRGFLDHYRPPTGHRPEWVLQFAGVEIMRRLIGYAQLPVDHGLPVRRRMLEFSRELVLAPAMDLLLKFKAEPS